MLWSELFGYILILINYIMNNKNIIILLKVPLDHQEHQDYQVIIINKINNYIYLVIKIIINFFKFKSFLFKIGLILFLNFI